MSNPVLYDTTASRTENDEKTPFLTDITVLVVDNVKTVVVNDRKNKCAKSFYTKDNKLCHSILPLDNSLYCITQLKSNQVMVTVLKARQIVTIEVTPNLVLLSTITTSKEYYSLAVLGPTSLAAEDDTDHCIYIFDMEGKVMKTLSTVKDLGLFWHPWCMCVDKKKNNLCLIGGERKSEICLTSEGDIVWIYAPLGLKVFCLPSGITTTSEGEILLVDQYSHRMTQLTETGQYVRDLLTKQDGLSYPQGIYVDNHGSLFVCEREQIKEFKF